MFNRLALAVFIFTYPEDCSHIGVELEDPITIDDLEKKLYCIKYTVDAIDWNVERTLLIERFAYHLQSQIQISLLSGVIMNQPLYSEMNCGAFLQMHFKCRSKLKIS